MIEFSKNIENLDKCITYKTYLNGLKLMIEKAPDNDKKAMLLDIVKYGLDLTENFKNTSNSISWYQWNETCLEFKIDQLKLRLKEKDILLEKKDKQIKELLK